MPVYENFSYIYYFRMDYGCEIIHRARKDPLPMRLFQFGDIKFASGFSDDPLCLHYYEQSCEFGDSAKLIHL